MSERELGASELEQVLSFGFPDFLGISWKDQFSSTSVTFS